MVWRLVPFLSTSLFFHYSVIILLVIIRLGVYPLLIAGWASNRKYALIGAIRGVAQTISYEIRLALILFSLLCWTRGASISVISKFNEYLILAWVALPGLFFLLVSCVAETNRAPFDFAEGESELVSGFNVEYGRRLFAIIFIAEYARILFLSTLLATIFSSSNRSTYSVALGAVRFVFFWVWLRRTFPRYRYDKLIRLAWKTLLPGTLFFIFSSLTFSII